MKLEEQIVKWIGKLIEVEKDAILMDLLCYLIDSEDVNMSENGTPYWDCNGENLDGTEE